MLIFVSSPYRGDIRANVERAKQYCRYVIEQGHTPFAQLVPASVVFSMGCFEDGSASRRRSRPDVGDAGVATRQSIDNIIPGAPTGGSAKRSKG